MSDTRAKRNAKPGAKAKASFAQFQELRRTGGKRVHDFELKEEEAVYDEVQEQDYAKLVQDRREEAGSLLFCRTVMRESLSQITPAWRNR